MFPNKKSKNKNKKKKEKQSKKKFLRDDQKNLKICHQKLAIL